MSGTRAILSVVILLYCSLAVAEDSKPEAPIDFLQVVKSDAKLSKASGVGKLDASEQATWNVLLNRAYRIGYDAGRRSSQPATPATKDPEETKVPRVNKGSKSSIGSYGYRTKVESDAEDVLKLTNGAVVQITAGFLGFVGFRKEAVLYKVGRSWRIWVEGKRAFRCRVLKQPTGASRLPVREVHVAEVTGDGSILKMLNGSVYEVDSLDTLTTSLWIGPFEALLIDGGSLVNLDDGDEAVAVAKLK